MGSTARRRTIQMRGGAQQPTVDDIALEEPLTIEVNDHVAATTMRTPGHDIELALGWLVSEGSVRTREDVADARECFDYSRGEDDVRRTVSIVTRDGRPPRSRLTAITSACGVCGSDVIDMATDGTPWSLHDDETTWTAHLVSRLPGILRDSQRGFATSGGLHAAAIIDAEGRLVCAREDVGRHNAVDKVIGWALMNDSLPLRHCALVVTSRASAELAHKCVRAGVPVLVAVSAPTTLAVDLAREAGLTLAGFAREGGFNVYAHRHRVVLA